VDSGMRSIVGGTVLLLLFSRGAIRAQDAFQLADGQVGTPYTYEIKTEGGLAPLHWSKVSGELPPGLTLRENTISGTPTLAQADPYEFALQVSDSSRPAQTYAQNFTLLIKALPLRMVLNTKPLRIVPDPPPVAKLAQQDPLQGGQENSPQGGQQKPAEGQQSLRQGGQQDSQQQGGQQNLLQAGQPDPPQADGSKEKNPDKGSDATSSLYTLGIAGIDATGASSAPTSAEYFAEFNLIAPLRFFGPQCGGSTDPLEGSCWVWFNPRIASVPVAANTALSSLSTSSSLVTGLAGTPVQQLTQSFQFQGGGEVYFIKPKKGAPFPFLNGSAKTSLSFILGAGATTPVSNATGARNIC